MIALVIYLLESVVPLDPIIKRIIYVVIVVGVLIWLLSIVGLVRGI